MDKLIETLTEYTPPIVAMVLATPFIFLWIIGVFLSLFIPLGLYKKIGWLDDIRRNFY